MSDPLPLGRKNPFGWIINKKNILQNKQYRTIGALMLIAGYFFYTANAFPRFYAQAYSSSGNGQQMLIDSIQQNSVFVKGSDKAALFVQNDLVQTVKTNKQLSEVLYGIVGDAPIREMVPYIAQRDQRIAALLVGIAKKESSWGSASPSKDGKTCYNYWGYKGAGSRGMAMGYGCYASPEEGVNVVGDRIEHFVDKGLTTPSELIVWKCGSSCKGHDPQGVKKWISDVNIYFNKVLASKK